MIKWIRTSRLSIKNSLSPEQVIIENEELDEKGVKDIIEIFLESSSSSLLLSSLELSDTTIYERLIRALLGTASHFCLVVVLKQVKSERIILTEDARFHQGVRFDFEVAQP